MKVESWQITALFESNQRVKFKKLALSRD